MRTLTLKIFSILLLFFALSCATQSKENPSLYFYSAKDGFSVLAGDEVYHVNRGLPERVEVERIYRGKLGSLYLATKESGLYRLEKDSSKWRDISSELFKRRTSLKDVEEYRKISAFAASDDEKTLYAATKHTIYVSTDGGDEWREYAPKFPSTLYITALDVRGADLYVGTSFEGVFKSVNGKFVNFSGGLTGDSYSGKRVFYEGVFSIRHNADEFLSSLYFDGGVYLSQKGSDWRKHGVPVADDLLMSYDANFMNGAVYSSTSKGVFAVKGGEREWMSVELPTEVKLTLAQSDVEAYLIVDSSLPELFGRKDVKREAQSSREMRGLYLTVYQASKNIQKIISSAKNSSSNAVVLDVKDDFGDIYAPVSNKIASDAGAVKSKFPVKKIVDELHKNGLKVIARMVMFKDKRLYDVYQNKFALWDKNKKCAWRGNKGEFWVDSFSEDVHNYNISLAEEVASLGFDEIQFDYVRFPSDGKIDDIEYRYRTYSDSYKSESIADFLQMARSRIKIPISADIYGFNACYRFGNRIGQDIEVIAKYVNAVSPMAYPSHYGRRYYASSDDNQRSYRIVYETTLRGMYLSNYRAEIRPYIQAFKLLSPTWGPEYIRAQVKGVENAGSRGFLFWNAASDYSMVVKSVPLY